MSEERYPQDLPEKIAMVLARKMRHNSASNNSSIIEDIKGMVMNLEIEIKSEIEKMREKIIDLEDTIESSEKFRAGERNENIQEIQKKLRMLDEKILDVEKKINEISIRLRVSEEKAKEESHMNKEIAAVNENQNYFELAMKFYASGDYKKALENLKKSLEMNPENSEAWFEMGKILVEMGALNRAEICFKRALAIDEKSIKALYALGSIYMLRQQYERALEYFNKLIELEPENALVLSKIALIYDRMGNEEEAIKYAERAIQIDPENKEAMSVLVSRK